MNGIKALVLGYYYLMQLLFYLPAGIIAHYPIKATEYHLRGVFNTIIKETDMPEETRKEMLSKLYSYTNIDSKKYISKTSDPKSRWKAALIFWGIIVLIVVYFLFG